MNLESCAFTPYRCLVIGQNLVIRMVSFVSQFKPLG